MTNELKCKLLDKIKVQQFTVLGLTTYFYIKKRLTNKRYQMQRYN